MRTQADLSQPVQTRRRPGPRRTPTRRGMTLFELMFAVLIIFLVMGLLIGAVRIATRTARDTTHQTAVLSIKQGITQFQQEFGFYPPLVMDNGAPTAFNSDPVQIINSERRVQVFLGAQHADFLRRLPRPTDLERRYSIYSIPYYLVGVVDMPRDPNDQSDAVDGLDGPGFRTPRRDGGFESSGRTFQPMFAVGSGSTSLFTEEALAGRIELRDSNGVPFRYYRWESGSGAPPPLGTNPEPYRQHLGVPRMVGDPVDVPEIRNAKYAIVAAGPNGLFGDEHHRDHPQHVPLDEMRVRLRLPTGTSEADIVAAARADNIVEVGQ